jgi:hypothetical protein
MSIATCHHSNSKSSSRALHPKDCVALDEANKHANLQHNATAKLPNCMLLLLLLLLPSSLLVDSVGHNSKLHQWLACGENCAWRLDRNMTRQQQKQLQTL